MEYLESYFLFMFFFSTFTMNVMTALQMSPLGAFNMHSHFDYNEASTTAFCFWCNRCYESSGVEGMHGEKI